MNLKEFFINGGRFFESYDTYHLYELKTNKGIIFVEISITDYSASIRIYNENLTKRIVNLDGSEIYEEEEDFSPQYQAYDLM